MLTRQQLEEVDTTLEELERTEAARPRQFGRLLECFERCGRFASEDTLVLFLEPGFTINDLVNLGWLAWTSRGALVPGCSPAGQLAAALDSRPPSRTHPSNPGSPHAAASPSDLAPAFDRSVFRPCREQNQQQ